MATKTTIRKFKKFWQVLNADGNTIFQSTSKEEAEIYSIDIARNLFCMKDVMEESVYERKAYRDSRYFVRF